jgi:Bacterial Ig-like domain (group 3)
MDGRRSEHLRPKIKRTGKKETFMRLRASKFVYLPIGGALAAGLLTSAIVLPQTKLAASQDCYGVCASTTTLTLSRSAVSVSDERRETFSVKVGAGARRTGVPTGSVDVELGHHVICRIHLSGGKGSCSLGGERLPPGSYELVAHYSGDSNFTPSTSCAEHLTVLAPSQAQLTLSRSTVPVSREGDVEFRVKVSEDGRPGVRPTGSVKVVTGEHDRVVLCRIDLSGGHGECSLKGRELGRGSYEIEALYSGDATVGPATSDKKQLEVTRG